MEILATGVRADRSAIVYLDEIGSMALADVHGMAVFSMDDPAISETVLQEAIGANRNLVYNDVKGDYQARGNVSLHLSGAVSVLCIPFYDEAGKPVGALYADTTRRPAAFHRREMLFARDCASWLECLLAGRDNVPPPELEEEVPLPRSITPSPPAKATPTRPTPETPRRPVRQDTHSDRVDTRELMVLFRSLAALTQAGVMIHVGLDALARSSEDKTARKVLTGLSEAVGRGEPLSSATERYPNAFPPYLSAAIRVGERTGRLVHVLDVMARDLEKGQRLTYRLRSALTYPALLAGACMLMMIFGPPYLLAGQLKVLSEMGTELPMLTKGLIVLSNITGQPVFLVLFTVGLALLVRWVTSPAGRVKLWLWSRHLPLLGQIVKDASVARFARTLSLQLRAGLTAFEGLSQARRTATDPRLEQALGVAEQGLRDGLTLMDSLRAGGYFSISFLSFIEAGENSGTLVKLTDWLADFYEREVETDLDRFVSTAEPVLMAVMGFFTTLLLVATLKPTIAVLSTL